MTDHSTSELKIVWISNVSGIQMFSIKIPTVIISFFRSFYEKEKLELFMVKLPYKNLGGLQSTLYGPANIGYSRDPNTRHVRYSNGLKLSDC